MDENTVSDKSMAPEDENTVPAENLTPEQLRELGKALYRSSDAAERSRGLNYLVEARNANDLEATYLVAKLLLQGVLRTPGTNSEEHALTLLRYAAKKGFLPARTLLNRYCFRRYEQIVDTKTAPAAAPLVDFEGKRIKIQRTGLLTPVDATLEFVNGINRLTLSANIQFFYDELLDEPERFKQAVLRGISAWQGIYKVFGNQSVQVVVKLTTEPRFFDNVVIIPVIRELESTLSDISDRLNSTRVKEKVHSLISDKRSCAAQGIGKWSVTSRKFIFIESEDGNFDDYDEIRHVTKHEFGHLLGLGDLYQSSEDEYNGVDKGTFSELDGFYIADNFYNLVMCDHHGPVSNNDIEMVILAFRENRQQLYQKQKQLSKGVISKALGKGN